MGILTEERRNELAYDVIRATFVGREVSLTTLEDVLSPGLKDSKASSKVMDLVIRGKYSKQELVAFVKELFVGAFDVSMEILSIEAEKEIKGKESEEKTENQQKA